MRPLRPVIAALAIALLCAGCLDDITEAPIVIPEGVGVPAAVTVQAGNGSVLLSWRSVAEAVSYRVYRSVDEARARATLAGGGADTFFSDTALENGRSYFYRVAAVGPDGLEGERSAAVAAIPAIYAVLINGGEPYTASAAVTLSLAAPASTENVMLSQDASFAGASWELYGAVRTYRLAEGDGERFVYARFRDRSGAVSPVVSDAIIRDSYARVVGLDFYPATRRYAPGATVSVIMRVEGNETGGLGVLSFAGSAFTVSLADDGRGGDHEAGDGSYEAQFAVPAALRGVDIAAAAIFTDRVGNKSPAFEGGSISITDPPQAVTILGAVDSSRTSITLKWTASTENHFSAYRIYRSTTPGVSETPSKLVRELYNRDQTSYPDGSLTEGARYYYRIFVVNDLDETAGSNEVALHTYDGFPVAPVLDEPTSVGATRATLTWSQNQDTDFREYRLYRALAPGVTTASTLVATIADREITFYDDTGLDTSANTYYYRLYVFDAAGKSSRSNEVDTAP